MLRAPPASDTAAPAVLAGPVVTGAATTSPVISGTSEAYALIILFDQGVRIRRIVAGANGAWSWTAPAFSAGSHSLTVTATDAAGNVSGVSPATTVASTAAPTISTQPGNVTVSAPAMATFTAAASGSPAPSYQWQSAPAGSTTFTAISGATAASYTTAATTTAMSGTQFRCVASNSAGSTTTAVATLTVDGLPSGWSSSDIGAVDASGSTTVASGVWTVTGSGADIWGTSDEFGFATLAVTGDVRITARITGLPNTNPWAKAGVMVRETLGATSRHAFTCPTASQGAAFQRRGTTAGPSTHTAGPALPAPAWVRLERIGDLFIAAVSSNGTTWTEIRRETITMGAAVQVGLAVTSHADGTRCTATFNDVTVVGAPSAAN